MALPTDVKTYTAPQLAAAVNAGTMTPSPQTSVDHTGSNFNFYNDGSGGLTAWRCIVVIPIIGQIGGARTDLRVTDIVAGGDTPLQMFQRLFAAAKIVLGIS